MKNFFDYKDEKITEKAFSQSITISVLSILLCVVALCSITWAWYSEDVTSSYNSMQSASCYVSVSVTSGNALVEPTDGKYTFYKGQAYTIKLTATGTAETAYCILNINGKDYYTEQIQITGEIEFTLQFSEETTIAEILPCWGTSSRTTRDFANDLYYLDCKETDPTTLVVTPAQTESTNATETTTTTEPTETKESSPEVTE